MRIGIDTISWGDRYRKSFGGFSTFLTQLLEALQRLDRTNQYVVYVSPTGDSVLTTTAPNFEKCLCLGLPSLKIGRILYEQCIYPYIAQCHKLDLLVSTHNIVPLLLKCRSLVIVQSLQFYTQPRSYSRLRRMYQATMLPLSLRKADAVIAVSETTKRDLVRYAKVKAAKVVVVKEGTCEEVRHRFETISKAEADDVVKRYIPGAASFVLYIATLQSFKNHERLIRAFALLRQRYHLPHKLVLVGQDGDVKRNQLERLAREVSVQDAVVFTGPVPHADVAALYARASLFVFPSLYETFGLPSLEAMICGCPIVASNDGAIAEVVGDSAFLIDPYSIQDIARGMQMVLTDAMLRETLIARGLVRSRQFTWENAARQLLEVLSNVGAQQ